MLQPEPTPYTHTHHTPNAASCHTQRAAQRRRHRRSFTIGRLSAGNPSGIRHTHTRRCAVPMSAQQPPPTKCIRIDVYPIYIRIYGAWNRHRCVAVAVNGRFYYAVSVGACVFIYVPCNTNTWVVYMHVVRGKVTCPWSYCALLNIFIFLVLLKRQQHTAQQTISSTSSSPSS